MGYVVLFLTCINRRDTTVVLVPLDIPKALQYRHFLKYVIKVLDSSSTY